MKQTFFTTLFIILCHSVFAQTTVQKTILFEFNKAVIEIKEHQALTEIIDFLQKEPTIQATLHGHTDNYGSNDYNLELSKKRVESVADYLLNHGIKSSQLILKPYGETIPVIENSTDENRQKNRRVVVMWQIPNQVTATPKLPKRKVIIIEKKAPKTVHRKISPFTQITPKPNTFHFYCHQDTILIGEKGTKVFVVANSFAINCGEETLIRLEMQEAVDKEAMLQKNLYTITTDGQILESYGMIELVAYEEGLEQPIALKEDKTIGFEVPSYAGEVGIEIFNGVKLSNGLRWKKSTVEQTYLKQGKLRGLSALMGWINLDKPYKLTNRKPANGKPIKGLPLVVKIPKVIEQEGEVIGKIYFKNRNIILPLTTAKGKPFLFEEGTEVVVDIEERNKQKGYKSIANKGMTITKPNFWNRIWHRNRIILKYESNPSMQEAL